MNLIKNRLATLLILVIILAACVHAHPNVGDDPFENNMDWPWDLYSMGVQFADAIVYNHFNAPMVGHYHLTESMRAAYACSKTSPPRPTNSRSITSPPRPSRPQAQLQLQQSQAPSINYDNSYFSFTGAGLAGPLQPHLNDPISAPILTFAPEQPPSMNDCNSSAMAPWADSRGAMQQQNQQVTSQPSFEAMSATANAANMYGYPDAPQAREQQLNSQPIPQQGFQDYGRTNFDLSMQLMDNELGLQQSHPVDSAPHMLPTEVTSNPNYQPGMVPSAAPGNMLGWINRAPVIGDRTLPSRLDTNMLVPPEANSANRSPTSASTTGSSTRGSRRQKWEMTGDFVCHWCNAGFTTQGDLTHHLRSHQPYLSRQHVCRHCEKRFQYRKDLTRHLPKHDPNRKRYYCIFKGCKYSSRGFGRQDHLDRHIQTQHRVDTPQKSSRPSSNHS